MKISFTVSNYRNSKINKNFHYLVKIDGTQLESYVGYKTKEGAVTAAKRLIKKLKK